jgi:hypothetical protein
MGRRSRRLLAAVLAAATCGAACRSSSVAPTTTTPAVGDTVPAASARYRITFEAVWSRDTHPTEIPPVPHFSGLIGATHKEATRFWELGRPSSNGIKNMAEEGSKSPLDVEIMAAIAEGGAEHLISGDGIPRSPGTATVELEVSRAQPFLTLVSMVAPSPDWFVGVSALSLIENGDWLPERVIALRPYDAGTDSGTTFLSANRPTQPREPISHLQQGPLVVGSEVPALGTFTLRRLP